MSLTLTAVAAPPGRVSLAGLTPDRLAGLTCEQIERLPLAWGRQTLVVADLFRVAGTPGDTLVIEEPDRRFCALGGGMQSGTFIVVGDAGDLLAQGMTGGRLELRGSAGRFAASAMAGGELLIEGNCGDQLGAPMPWLGAGMAGGRVIVRGNAGARCGDRMRRGEIYIGGAVAELCATRMVAGTIAVAGACGAQPAYAMRRGTLLLLSAAYAPGATFVPTAACLDAYLGLLWRQWARQFAVGSAFGDVARRALARALPVQRWMGDLASDGRGEVLAFGA